MEMSGRVVHKLYWDFEREERWLNEMASEGWQLERYRLGRYQFGPGEPGAWIYRIELLPAALRSGASREYLSLLQDAGVEIVSSHVRWVYLRRRAALGPFELFTDLESRIAHYQRVLGLFGVILAALAAAAGSLVVSSRHSGGLALDLPLIIVAAAMVVLAVQTVRLSRRVRSLRAQRQIYE
jgi:hypothetical protein